MSDLPFWPSPALNRAALGSLALGLKFRLARLRREAAGASSWRALPEEVRSGRTEIIASCAGDHDAEFMASLACLLERADAAGQGANAVGGVVRALDRLVSGPLAERFPGATRPPLREPRESPEHSVLLMDEMCSHLIARLPNGCMPRDNEGRTWQELLSEGGAPFVAYPDRHPGFPVLVERVEDGHAFGFPTDLFAPSLWHARRREWLRRRLLPPAKGGWARVPMPEQDLEAVMEAARAFYEACLPPSDSSWETAMTMPDLARALGVTVPRLSSWLHAQGLLVRPEWGPSEPSPDLLARGWVFPAPAGGWDDDDASEPGLRWGRTALEGLAPHVDDIGKSKARPLGKPPSDAQLSLAKALCEDLGVGMPRFSTSSGARKAIDALVAERERRKGERMDEVARRLGVTREDPGFVEACRGLVAENAPVVAGDLVTSMAGTPVRVERLGKPWVLKARDRERFGLPPGEDACVRYAWGIPELPDPAPGRGEP